MTQSDVVVKDQDIFLTAADAYPALERAFLGARSNISAGFRVFDPRTKLRASEAKQIGDNWYDLIVHTLARGVSFRLVLTDFDPVVRPAAHRMTWRAVRRLITAAEASGRPELLDLTPAMHSARISKAASVFLWPKTMREVAHEAKRLNGLSASDAERDVSFMPLLAPHLTGLHPNFRPKMNSLPRLVPTTHHQKLAVFDSETLYIGGLDLDERRYDTPLHNRPGEDTWRDCQIITSGPIAKEAETHLAEVAAVTSGTQAPSPLKHLLRTLSAPNDKFLTLSPKPVLSELEDAHIQQSKAAHKLIYLETQFFRSIPLAENLVAAAAANPDLRLLLILPAAPEDVAFMDSTKSDARYGEYLQAKCLDMVAQGFGDRFFAAATAQPRKSDQSGRAALKSAPLVYLHAKVSIFDEGAAIVSSANLNGRSLRWDTEAGIALRGQSQVRQLLRKCIQHWLPDGTDVELNDVFGQVRHIAQENAQKSPKDRAGFLLPYVIGPARRFGRNLPGVPEEMT